jgi:uncharacterized protein (DUF302 family)
MTDARYGITKSLGHVEFDRAVDRVTEALKEVGFGVLTDIDVKATMKQKLDADFRPYRILGACDPPLAKQALESEPLIGLLLPCNVVVLEEEDGTVTASAVNPTEMFKVVDRPEMRGLAEQVGATLESAFARL